ncbi:MAG: flavodoxin, partial [Oscillospiraceae bacterium]|nr:flavodoxin [Oscillospiraceae bacterium]
IWWGDAPRIISTFLESYDFSEKNIIPFCTSVSSGIGSSAEDLQSLADDAEWYDGRRFAASASESDVEAWIDTLDIED